MPDLTELLKKIPTGWYLAGMGEHLSTNAQYFSNFIRQLSKEQRYYAALQWADEGGALTIIWGRSLEEALEGVIGRVYCDVWGDRYIPEFAAKAKQIMGQKEP